MYNLLHALTPPEGLVNKGIDPVLMNIIVVSLIALGLLITYIIIFFVKKHAQNNTHETNSKKSATDDDLDNEF